ncbi:RrF2 family transcriptional regulator [Christensenella intestinihominis]|uniref:RrF2 family transcriptional regulator n=1 Tax=Christensenella intestinihominis TaxID=1851429 RepID=UPI00082EEEA8|nr:Rrf2 family transcriptional regulator [Christensenella intestinihominis]
MKIQATTGYALRILQYIHEQGNRTITGTEMAEKLDISYLYMMKLLGKMKAAGFIRSLQGCNGGYRMAKTAEKITVFEVYAAIEGTLHLYDPQADVRCNNREAAIKEYFDGVEDMIVLSMRRTTIRDLFDRHVKGKKMPKRNLRRIAE